jgi:hypothetical protein
MSLVEKQWALGTRTCYTQTSTQGIFSPPQRKRLVASFEEKPHYNNNLAGYQLVVIVVYR